MSKRVEFDVTANTRQAQQGFAQLDGQIMKNAKGLDVYAQRQRQANNASMNFMRIAQDAPFFMTSMSMGIMSVSNNIPMFIESMERAKVASGGWMGAIKSVGKSMMSVPNLLMLGVSAITAWSIASGGATAETNRFAASVEKLISIETGVGKLGITKSQIPGALGKAERMSNLIATQLSAIKGEGRGLQYDVGKSVSGFLGLGGLPAEQEKQLEILEREKNIYDAIIQKLKEAQREQEIWNSLKATGLGSAGAGAVGDIQAMGFMADPSAAFKVPDKLKGVKGVKSPQVQFKEYKRAYEQYFIAPAAMTFREAMGDAWTDIFGEANSIAEKFIQRFASNFLNAIADNLGATFMGFLFPGGGGILDTVTGARTTSNNLAKATKLRF